MQGRSRILVIEDDPMFRNLVVSILRKDYLVAVAGDGKSGYEKALTHRPDLIIIDHQMPVWDGLTTLKKFHEHSIFGDTKFVMLTADASKDTVMSAIQAGTDDYIIKTTFSRDIFAAKIGRLLAPTLVKAVSTSAPKYVVRTTKDGEQFVPVTAETEAPSVPADTLHHQQKSSGSAVQHSTPVATAQRNSHSTPEKPVSKEELAVDLMMDEWD